MGGKSIITCNWDYLWNYRMWFCRNDSEIKMGQTNLACLEISIWSGNEMKKSWGEEKGLENWGDSEKKSSRVEKGFCWRKNRKYVWPWKAVTASVRTDWNMMTDSRHSDMSPRSLLTKGPVNPTAGVCQQATFSSQPFQQLPLLQKATLIKVTHTITDQRGNINLNIWTSCLNLDNSEGSF